MINWKSILSSFNDKPTLLEWLKLVEKALKESVLTNVLTDTKDGKTAFTFKFEDGTEIKTDYIQTQGEVGPKGDTGPQGDVGPQGPQGPQGPKGDPDGTSITRVEEISNEVVGNQTVTTLRIYLSNGTFNDVAIYAKNGSDINLKTITKRLTIDDITPVQGQFIVMDTSLLLTYNEDYSLINLSGRISLSVSSTVSGIVAARINISPVEILRNYGDGYTASAGAVYQSNFADGLSCSISQESGLILRPSGSLHTLSNDMTFFEVNTNFFLKGV